MTPKNVAMISQAYREAVSDIVRKLHSILQELSELQKYRPGVLGVQKFQNRVKRELRFAETLAGASIDSATKAGRPVRELSDVALAKNIKGLDNNIRGLAAELEVARAAPGLVAISQVFPFEGSSEEKGRLATSKGPRNVEVDVVAQNGNLWIEVKDATIFGTGSSRWMGCTRHVSGIQQQAQLRLQAARLPCNQRKWRPAAVLFHFPSGIDAGVASELGQMGVLVSGPGGLDASVLPTPPPAPTRTNLDVTTMCAMCSEVTNGGSRSTEVQKWAARTPHWKECLEAEKEEPLLQQIMPFLDSDRHLLASEAAVQQFEILLARFGGQRERQRWRQLLQRLQVMSSESPESQSARVMSLPDGRSISQAQRAMLSLGDALRACTLTANMRAVQAAAAHGVYLEAVMHRAVWLTGL